MKTMCAWSGAARAVYGVSVWLTMLGASAVIHVEGHCSIDVLVLRMSPRWRRIISIVSDLVVLVTLGLLIWFGIILTIKGQTKLTPILGLPYSYIDASIPVCCSFMFMYYGRMFWNSLRGKGNTTELDVQEESQQ